MFSTHPSCKQSPRSEERWATMFGMRKDCCEIEEEIYGRAGKKREAGGNNWELQEEVQETVCEGLCLDKLSPSSIFPCHGKAIPAPC